MDEFETKLNILYDALIKKEDALSQILAITENQAALLAEDHNGAEAAAFFKEMNVEKQRLIDTVLDGDGVFERIFGSLGGEFDERAAYFKPLVKRLQDKIKDVVDLDVKIRLQEDRNNAQITSAVKQKPRIDVPKASKGYMLSQYRKNAGK